jgi:hypothetical protein
MIQLVHASLIKSCLDVDNIIAFAALGISSPIRQVGIDTCLARWIDLCFDVHVSALCCWLLLGDGGSSQIEGSQEACETRSRETILASGSECSSRHGRSEA